MLWSRRAAPLATRLRRETRSVHRLVESTRLAKAFFRGALHRETYAEGLARLYPVYAAMEAHLAALPPGHRLTAFFLPDVFRAAAILADLRFFGIPAEPLREGASARYHARIQQLISDDSPLLVAHAYVRYMADVSGGVIAGRVAQRVLRLDSHDGLAFLSFPSHVDPPRFRTSFRVRLNAFSEDPEECARIVEEAKLAFSFNRELADEMWDTIPTRAAAQALTTNRQL